MSDVNTQPSGKRPRSEVETLAGVNHKLAPGMKRLRLTVAYCGTPWRGWQSLSGGRTVQDELNASIRKSTGIITHVHGSGRTDAGVHALAQVAHVDVPETVSMTPDAWVSAMNACLPLTIRVTRAEAAGPEFHSRFEAIGKTYRYRIWRPTLMSPFESDRAWHVYGPLDTDAIRECARMLVGTHNFVRLSANRGDMPETERRRLVGKTTRTLHRVDVHETDELLEIEFEGEGFLYKMVRFMVGSLVQVGRGRSSKAWFAELLSSAEGLQSNQQAPACGLYLVGVRY
jgi:tRNA pseudouridine38-40 synthase